MPEQFLAPDPPQQQQEQFLPPDSPTGQPPAQQAQPTQPAQSGMQPPQQQVAAGQGAITPQQVPAGQGAIGPTAIMGGVGDWIHQGLAKAGLSEKPGPSAGWPQGPGEPDPLDWLAQTAKKGLGLPEKLEPEAEKLWKNFIAAITPKDPKGFARTQLSSALQGEGGAEPSGATPQPSATPVIPKATAKTQPAKTTQLRQAPPEIESAIDQAAQKYRLDPKLIRAVIQSESSFNPKATGTSGEIGLMQLMPETRTQLGISDEDARDIEKNIDAGARWLKQKIDSHGGDLRHGLTAYNGSGAKARQYADNVLALYGGGGE